MGPIPHLTLSAAAAVGFYAVTKDVPSAMLCFWAGILPDADHFLEYAVYKRLKWDSKEFWSGRYFIVKGEIYILFHSIELAIILTVLCITMIVTDAALRNIISSITIGYWLHIILDIIGNDCTKHGYFIIYRFINKWKIEKICNGEEKV
jgi:membrane-bound metal-dependent hydrolase YbcI (DUF457 family)